MKTAIFALLGVLCVLAAAMLYRLPVRAYAVTCERAVGLACMLERTDAAGAKRARVPLPESASAVVRLQPQRRGASRVFLYLQTREQPVFAAEFEGADAEHTANLAAAKLNRVLQSPTTSARVRVDASPPSGYKLAAWTGLGVMALIILIGARASRHATAW